MEKEKLNEKAVLLIQDAGLDLNSPKDIVNMVWSLLSSENVAYEVVPSVIKFRSQRSNDDTSCYDEIRSNSYIVGYGNFYLMAMKKKCRDPDVAIYKDLIEIDSRLGTTNSEQLYGCLQNTTSPDIITV